MKTCSLVKCNTKLYAKGLCSKHYQRKKIYGNAEEPYRQRFTGRSKTIDYSSYTNMIARCVSPTATGYHLYGGRGIKVCDRWLNDGGFANFIEDVGPRPSAKHTIDRIDVNGNYEPGNCRWVSYADQARNKRVNPSNISKVAGVTPYQFGKGRWKATIWANYKNIHIGIFPDMESAITARKEAEIKHWNKGDK